MDKKNDIQRASASDDNETILVVNMFSGKYPEENIGHEIINLFRTDNNENYLYIPASGNIPRKGISKVIMVRRAGNKRYEVIGRAKVKEPIEDEKPYSKKSQVALLRKLKYGHKRIEDILSTVGQTFDGVSEKISFLADNECKRPMTPLYLIGEDQKHRAREDHQENTIIYRGRLFFRSQRRYVTSEKFSDEASSSEKTLFDQLNKVFSDESGVCWENFPKISDEALVNGKASRQDGGAGFLSLIHMEERELPYSDLFAHFLKEYPAVGACFVNLLLRTRKVDASDDQDLVIQDIAREEDRVDLLIKTPNRVFIVENKVHSPLNESYKNEEGFLYVGGQLQKYAEVEEKKHEKDNKDILVYVICPNYHQLYLDQQSGIERKVKLNREGADESVIVVSYDEIHNALSDQLSSLCASIKESKENNSREVTYFMDFLSALEWQQTDHTGNLFFEKNKESFIKAINQAPSESRN